MFHIGPYTKDDFEMNMRRKKYSYPILLSVLIALAVLVLPGAAFANHNQELRCTGVIVRHPQCRLSPGDNLDSNVDFNAVDGDFDTCFAQVDFSKCVSAQWEEGKGKSHSNSGDTGGFNKGEFEFIERNKQKIHLLDEAGCDIGNYEVKSFGLDNSDAEAFEHRRSFFIFLHKPLEPDCVYQIYVDAGVQSRNGMSSTAESTSFTFKTRSADKQDLKSTKSDKDAAEGQSETTPHNKSSNQEDGPYQGKRKTLASKVVSTSTSHLPFLLTISIGILIVAAIVVKNKRMSSRSQGINQDFQEISKSLSKGERSTENKDDKAEK